MSRFSDYDDFDGSYDLWEHNAHLAINGKRGRKALAELREALLALPEKRLIEGALCTVGNTAEAAAIEDILPGGWRKSDLLEAVEGQGEGVCAIGAYVWYKQVKAGATPEDAFEKVRQLGDDANDTADAGKRAGLTFTLAWSLAYQNDEGFAKLTPEQRYIAFLGWIDRQLAKPPLVITRKPPKPKPSVRDAWA